MKYLIFSGKYYNTLPYFAKLWNKYMSPDTDVYVLSSQDKLPKLPDNFTHWQLSKFTKSWVNDISEFFESVPGWNFEDEVFFSCMEDHYLYAPANFKLIQEWEQRLKSNPKYVKFGFRVDNFSYKDAPEPTYTTEDCYYNVPIRQSLMPSIWRTEFFKILLDNSKGYSAWDFELRPRTGGPYKLEDNILEYLQDKETFCTQPEPFPCIDLVRQGQDNKAEWQRYVKDPEDIEIFEQARLAL